MNAPRHPPKPKISKTRKRVANVVGAVFGLTILIGIPMVIGMTCYRDHEVREARDEFVFAVESGHPQTAYEQLTAERRAHMTLEEFEIYLQHPVIQALNEATFSYDLEDDHPGMCMDGYVPQPDGRWYVQMFFLKEDGQWRVHTIGLQRPARIALASIIHECGFWKGTLRGYSGPRPEHVMPKTRNMR